MNGWRICKQDVGMSMGNKNGSQIYMQGNMPLFQPYTNRFCKGLRVPAGN